MSEEKKGKLKVTLEVEINEQLMDVMKEGISNAFRRAILHFLIKEEKRKLCSMRDEW